MTKKTHRSANGSGHIRKRSDGTWEGQYTAGYGEDGKQLRRSVYGRTQKECLQKLQATTLSLSKGAYVAPDMITVGEWLDVWMAEYAANLKPSTRNSYAQHIKNSLKPHIGSVRLQKLTAPMLQSLYRQRLEGTAKRPPVSAKTVNNLHGVIHSALKQAVDLDYLTVNPADKCKLPKLARFEMKPLGDKLPDFLQAIRGHRFERLYLTALNTGMRESEIVGFSWDCIDFDQATIRVYRQLQRVRLSSPQNTTASSTIWLPLKNNRPRVIPAPATLLEVLREQKRYQAEMQMRAGAVWSNPDNLVFTNEIGHYLNCNRFTMDFKTIVRGVGCPETRFHDLRHQYAINSLLAGIDVKQVQEALGHHSAAFTLDMYCHVTDGMRTDAAAKLDRYLSQI
jgi:integrase